MKHTMFLGLIAAGLMLGCTTTTITDGTGGNGGEGGSTTGTGTTTATNGTTTATTGTTTTTGVTSTSTGTGMDTCDDIGVCQGNNDPNSECVACALAGQCADQYNACLDDASCIAFEECIIECPDNACVEQCAGENPNGAQLYQALIFCAVCDVCPISCDGPGYGCP